MWAGVGACEIQVQVSEMENSVNEDYGSLANMIKAMMRIQAEYKAFDDAIGYLNDMISNQDFAFRFEITEDDKYGLSGGPYLDIRVSYEGFDEYRSSKTVHVDSSKTWVDAIINMADAIKEEMG